MKRIIKHLSASSVTNWLTCPLMWWGGREKWPQEDLIAMQMGTVVHKAVEVHHHGGNAGQALMELWGTMVTDRHARPDAIHDCAAAVALYQARYAPTPGAEMEQKFELEIDGVPVPIIGYKDLREDGLVVDLKTTSWANAWSQKKVDESLQMTTYLYHERQKTRRNFIGEIRALVLRAEPILNVFQTARTDNDYLRLRQLYRQAYEGMTEGTLEPKCAPSKCRYPQQCAMYRREK